MERTEVIPKVRVEKFVFREALASIGYDMFIAKNKFISK